MIRKSLLSFSMAMMVIWTGLAWSQSAAQTPSGNSAQSSMDQDIDLFRKDVRSQKKQIIAANLQLTDQEAVKFWPLYDQYTAELVKINNKKYATIQKFADQFGTLTDDQAMSLIQQWLSVDTQVAQLRTKYLPIVAQAIGGKQAATWAQLDRRLQRMIDLQLGARVPLVQSQ